MADETQLTPAHRTCPTCNNQVAGTLASCPHDGTTLVDLPPPRQLGGMKASLTDDPAFRGKYEFLGTIGSGGMGVIYKARQILLNKFVAIKMVHPHLVSPKVFHRFETEARAAGKLTHPNIVAVHDYGRTEEGQPYMVLDYVDGSTLDDVLKKQGPISEIRFHRIFKQICDALALAHHEGVLHRDLKPSNIMLVKNDKGLEDARVMDFGIAKILLDPDSNVQFETKSGESIGSPPYMSPEQALGRAVDDRSDLYSLGCLMYESLNGAPPFTGHTALDVMAKHISDAPVPLSKQSHCAGIDPQLEQVVMRLLAKAPEERYPDVVSVLNDLNTVSKGESLRATKYVAEAAPRSKAKIAAVAVCALFIPIFLYYIWNSLDTRDPLLQKPTPQIAPPVKINKDTVNTVDKPTTEDALDMSQLLMASKAKVYVQDLIEKKRQINFSDVGDMYEVTRADLEPLASPEASYVTQVKLRELHLTDDDIMPLAKCHLEYLNLDNNKVQKLTALKGMMSLHRLSLSQTNVDHDGVAVVGGLKNMITLYLDANMLHDSDLPLLYDMPHLIMLDISKNPLLTAPAVRELKKHLPPNCALRSEFIPAINLEPKGPPRKMSVFEK